MVNISIDSNTRIYLGEEEIEGRILRISSNAEDAVHDYLAQETYTSSTWGGHSSYTTTAASPPEPSVRYVQGPMYSYHLQPAMYEYAEDNPRYMQRHLATSPPYMEADPYVKAEKKAEELLRMYLNPGQIAELDKTQRFTVRSQLGNMYRIYEKRVYNIGLINENDECETFYCAGPGGLLPLGDVMLAQKLSLELNEEKFLAVANARRDVALWQAH